MRTTRLQRKTNETDIRLSLTIEGRGRYKVSTGIRFFDHMLELFARHGAFDLQISCNGDLDVDQHHTVEDVGIALGEAFERALGSKRGILRAGYFLMPMDETLGMAAVDFGGRSEIVVDTKVRTRTIGDCSRNWCTISSMDLRVEPGECARQSPVRTFEPSQGRIAFQGICSRGEGGLLERKAAGKNAAQYKGTVVIAIVDYRAGNMASVLKAFRFIGAEAAVTADPEMVRRAHGIVLLESAISQQLKFWTI